MSDNFVPVFAKTTDGKPLTREQVEALMDDLREDAQIEEKPRVTKGGDRAGQAESAAPPSHARDAETAAERAVLEEAENLNEELKKRPLGDVSVGHVIRFSKACAALRAARRPEKVERPPMVGVEFLWGSINTEKVVGWFDELYQRNDGVWLLGNSWNDWDGVHLRQVTRVLPASQVEGGYTPAEQALADGITKAMEARRAHSPD